MSLSCSAFIITSISENLYLESPFNHSLDRITYDVLLCSIVVLCNIPLVTHILLSQVALFPSNNKMFLLCLKTKKP